TDLEEGRKILRPTGSEQAPNDRLGRLGTRRGQIYGPRRAVDGLHTIDSGSELRRDDPRFAGWLARSASAKGRDIRAMGSGGLADHSPDLSAGNANSLRLENHFSAHRTGADRL